jgi:cell wall-associated NlpC family hydrolase
MRPLLAAVLTVLSPAIASASPDAEALESPQFHAVLALGTHYRYGGRSPESGFDCSGLVAHVFQRAWGLLLPRGVDEQAALGDSVSLKELAPGDLVFYNTRNRAYSHVGIYVGDGRFVHAPRRGQRVRAEFLENPYWKARFNGARRLARPQ